MENIYIDFTDLLLIAGGPLWNLKIKFEHKTMKKIFTFITPNVVN